VSDRAFRGIFDRHNAKISSPPSDVLKDFRDGRSGSQVGRRAEFLARSQMRVSRRGAKERDVQWSLETPATRNDFPKNRADNLRRERSAVQLANALENFLLAMGSIDFLMVIAFGTADLLR
jgi:hypothetical protein